LRTNPKVGLLGLGLMGSAVAAKLLRGGLELTVFNRTAAKAKPFVELGARLARSPVEAAGGRDVLITLVANDEALEALACGEQGFLMGLDEAKVLIDMSTLTPGAIRRTAAAALARGSQMLHAPILGGPEAVLSGRATVFVGGPEPVYKRVRSVLEAISEPVHYVGDLTSGTLTKMSTNVMLTHLLMGTISSLALAKRAGLDQMLVLETLSRIAGVNIERIGRRMIEGERKRTFSIRNLVKDQHYFYDTAAELGIDLPTISAARDYFIRAADRGLGEEDFTALYSFMLGEAEEGQ